MLETININNKIQRVYYDHNPHSIDANKLLLHDLFKIISKILDIDVLKNILYLNKGIIYEETYFGLNIIYYFIKSKSKWVKYMVYEYPKLCSNKWIIQYLNEYFKKDNSVLDFVKENSNNDIKSEGGQESLCEVYMGGN